MQRQQADLMVTATVEEMKNKLSALLNIESEAGVYVCMACIIWK